MNDDPVRIIITGGTFDKHYDEIKGVLTFQNSNLPEIIRKARIMTPVEYEQIDLIDSLEMTDGHREQIAEACKRAHEKRIIITHGTDRMAETARYLGPLGINKTIILTGAMIPYQIYGSDAPFNFGGAFMAARLMQAGVYIAMNGRTFAWQDVHKDYEKGIFRPIDE